MTPEMDALRTESEAADRLPDPVKGRFTIDGDPIRNGTNVATCSECGMSLCHPREWHPEIACESFKRGQGASSVWVMLRDLIANEAAPWFADPPTPVSTAVSPPQRDPRTGEPLTTVSAAVSPVGDSEFPPSGLKSVGQFSGEPAVSPAEPPEENESDRMLLMALGRLVGWGVVRIESNMGGAWFSASEIGTHPIRADEVRRLYAKESEARRGF